MDYKKLIENGESKTLELKEKIPSNKKLAKAICAFANTSGGKLIIGVTDNLNVIGINDLDIFNTKDQVSSIIYDTIAPIIFFDIYTVNIDDKTVLVIDVPRGRRLPYYLKSLGRDKGVYFRLGATNRLADFQTIVDLERQNHNLSFDEEPDYDYGFEDIDIIPLKNMFKKVNKELTLNKMLNLKLVFKINDKIVPTRGLLILLGIYDHCEVKCARFRGSSMATFSDKKEYTSNIFSQLENVEGFILNHINISAEIKGLQRKDIPEIPIVAIREAITNALIHRDYTNSGRDIKVSVFDDYVRILSPGSLPPKLSYEDLFSGRSEIRNKVVAKVMKELDLIEKWGSGINRILDSCQEMDLRRPEIIEKNDFVEVNLFRKKTEAKWKIPEDTGRYRKIPEDKFDSITEEYKKVISYLEINKSITRKKSEQLLGIKTSRAAELIAEMISKGQIIKKGNGPKTHYILNRDK